MSSVKRSTRRYSNTLPLNKHARTAAGTTLSSRSWPVAHRDRSSRPPYLHEASAMLSELQVTIRTFLPPEERGTKYKRRENGSSLKYSHTLHTCTCPFIHLTMFSCVFVFRLAYFSSRSEKLHPTKEKALSYDTAPVPPNIPEKKTHTQRKPTKSTTSPPAP